MAKENKSNLKKILVICGIIVAVFFAIGLFGGKEETGQSNQQNENNTNSTQENSANNVNASASNEEVYMESLRRCSVIEAFDIQTTGIGSKTDNAFNDGRTFCESSLNTTYDNNKDDFIKDVTTDWENRKNEQIDGKDMAYYLSILNW